MAVTVTENPEIWSDSLFLLVLLRFTTCFTTFYYFVYYMYYFLLRFHTFSHVFKLFYVLGCV